MCALGWRLGCKAPATVRPSQVCSGWKCRHDALVMLLLLRQDATDEGVGGAGAARRYGSLDLECYCLNVDHRPGDQVCPERRCAQGAEANGAGELLQGAAARLTWPQVLLGRVAVACRRSAAT